MHQSVPGNTTHPPTHCLIFHLSPLYSTYPRVTRVRLAHTLNFSRAPETVLCAGLPLTLSQLLIIHRKGATAINQSNPNRFLNPRILSSQGDSRERETRACQCSRRVPRPTSAAARLTTGGVVVGGGEWCRSERKHVTERHVSQRECMPHPHNRQDPSFLPLLRGFCSIGDSAFKQRRDAGYLYLGGPFSLTTAPRWHSKTIHQLRLVNRESGGGIKGGGK